MTMKILCLFFLILNGLYKCDEIFPVYKDVIVLNDQTFQRGLNVYKYLMVMFYAPWSEDSQKIFHEYEMASSALKKENLYLAKIDGSVENRMVQKYFIEQYPTLLFFYKGTPKAYKGENTEQDIIRWMRENAVPDFKELNTIEEVEAFTKKGLSVIYFGNNEQELEEYKIAERKIYDIPFGLVKNEEIIKKFAVEGSVVLFKSFDEKRNDLKDLKSSAIIKFIQNYSLPKVIPFDTQTAPIIFGDKRPAVILFEKKRSPKWEEYHKLLYKVGQKLLGKMLVVHTDIEEGVSINLAEFTGVKSENLPTVKLIDPIPENPQKYELKGEITEENIYKLVDDWEKKKIRPYFKSQPIPTENWGDVYSIVGLNFNKEVLENDKDVLVFFYAPWCTHCKESYLEYEKVAKKLRKKNPKLLIAKIDATENDVEPYVIDHFPTIKFFAGNQKNQKPFDYRKRKTESEFISFLKEKCYNKLIVDEPEGEKKKDEKTGDL